MLYLTYRNEGFTDGLGAQLQRIYGIYSLSKFLNCIYYHSDIKTIDYHGLEWLRTKQRIRRLEEDTNNLFQISALQNNSNINFEKIYFSENPTAEILLHLKNEAMALGKNILLQMHLPYAVLDRFPGAYKYASNLVDYETSLRYLRSSKTGVPKDDIVLPDKNKVRIALHIRRGETMAHSHEQHRILNNSYYIKVAEQITRILDNYTINYVIEIHIEIPVMDFTIPVSDIQGRDEGKYTFTRKELELEDFRDLPNMIFLVNQHPLASFLNLATSDIIATARSSFSYTAAVIGRPSVVISTPFHHRPLPWWVESSADNGVLDLQKLEVKIKEFLS